MKLHNILSVKLDKIIPGGQALGTLSDGKKAFVWGGLPDEVVEFEVTKSKKNYVEGIVKKVVQPSKHRISPRDECYLCTSPWQTMGYDYELMQKTQIIKEAFRQQGIEGLGLQIMTNGQEYSYRNKMEYSLWWDKEKEMIDLAFHKRGSHQKIVVTKSSIERPEIWREAQKMMEGLNSMHANAFDYQSIMIRCNQAGETSSALFKNGQPHPKMKKLTDTLLGYEYNYSPNGFFQINLPVYEMVLKDLVMFMSERKVVDMYAGVGTIGLTIARDKDLVLVETDKNAYEEMTKNIPNGANNITPVHSKSEEALEYITSDALIILDPPRAGLDEKVVQKLIATLPHRIIYLSCNPITQARDIKPLLKKYKISFMQGYNFFPRTPHIENLAVLDLK